MSKNRKVIINKAPEASKHLDSKGGTIWISLPRPEKGIVEQLEDDGIIGQYFNTIKSIAETEASTIEKVAKIKFSGMKWMLLIVCIFLVIVLTLLISDKVQIKFNGKEMNSERIHKK